jgi:hypothetical protein
MVTPYSTSAICIFLLLGVIRKNWLRSKTSCRYEAFFHKTRNFTRKSFNPIPDNFMPHLDDELADILNENPQEKCENFSRSMGRLETPSIWKNHIVCIDCY